MKLCAVVNIFIIYVTFFIDAVLMEYCLKCTTKIDQSFKRILTRKRRLVVFPPSASILLTPSLSKGLISMYPRAVVNSIEVDFYHPLPETLEGWRPKIFDKKSKIPDKTKTMMGRNDTMSAVKVEDAAAWAPSGGWSKPFEFEKFWIPTDPIIYKSHVIPDGPFTKYNFKEDFQQQQYQKWQPHRKSWAFPQTESFRPKYIYNWSNYRAHRERRELYETMENAGSLLRLNMKSCILRAICEAKHYLLPPGVSLVQDIIRTLFTNKPNGEHDDVYTNAGELNEEDCSKMFENECPFSIIEIILHSDRFV